MNQASEPSGASAPTPGTWLRIMAEAYSLFDDLASRGFEPPPFSLGGGTVLMLEYRHRLSKDIDLFAHDVQWLGLLTPRLNERAASLACDYVEQANSVKIVTNTGDIDFIIASDVTAFERTSREIAGRSLPVDPPSEILAKKLFYRAATLKPRDVYDLSTVIDLAPEVAATAIRAAASKRHMLLRRLEELDGFDAMTLLREIIPYEGRLAHADSMVAKVRAFINQTETPT